MSTYVNYFIEANVGLSLLAVLYFVFLRNETDFRLKRQILLIGIGASLISPLFHFQNQTVAELQTIVPTIWLPELEIVGSEPATETVAGPTFSGQSIMGMLYSAGLLTFLLSFLWQVFKILSMVRSFPSIKKDSLMIAEADHNYPSFSFFNFIFIGNADALTPGEKRQIVAHESIHAKQYHSLDIMLVSILQIFFWCNPIVHLYKNIFIQLHEFEADSRAVDSHSVDEYCNLLARVALMSADLRIANHFSNSLTLKRIQMMRKIKFRTRPWKIVAMATALPVFFVGVACNDEVVSEMSGIVQDTQMALDVPANVQERFDQLSAANPEKKFVLLEMSGAHDEKLKELESKFGLPVAFEMFKEGEETIAGKSEAGVILQQTATNRATNRKTFIILEYNESTRALADLSNQDNVFTVVEKSASFPDGMTGLFNFIANEINYPGEARSAGIEGKVFVEFIVEPDGSISNVSVKKGVHASIDAEAVRVMNLSPKWNPGMQKGVAVRQKLVLPINFNLDKNTKRKTTSSLMNVLYPIQRNTPSNGKDKC